MLYICMFTNTFTIWQKTVLVIFRFETPDNFVLTKNNLEMYPSWKQSTVEVLRFFQQYHDAKQSLLFLLQWRLSFNSNISTGICVGGGDWFLWKKKQTSLSPDPCWRENSALFLHTFPSYVQTHSTTRRGLADWVLRLAELWRLHYVYHMCEFVPSHRSGCKPRLVCWLCSHTRADTTRTRSEENTKDTAKMGAGFMSETPESICDSVGANRVIHSALILL